MCHIIYHIFIIWQATHRHGNLGKRLKLNFLEAILVFWMRDADRTLHRKVDLHISWHSRWWAVSLWSTGHNSLAVRHGGAKAEGPVFSLTLCPLMSNTPVFTEVNRSYLVTAVDTGCYWAHRQLRADVWFYEFWRDVTHFREHWSSLYTVPYHCIHSKLMNKILALLFAGTVWCTNEEYKGIFYWSSHNITIKP